VKEVFQAPIGILCNLHHSRGDKIMSLYYLGNGAV